MLGTPDPRLSKASAGDGLGPRAEPVDGWLGHRLAQGVAEGIAELGSDKTLWLEANAAELNGVSFSKGCYVGQENTARMNWRQKVGRRLVLVRSDDDPGEAANIWYPALGLAVERRRVETIAGDPAVNPCPTGCASRL